MSYTRENRYVGYSNIAPGQAAGLENYCAVGAVPATPPTMNNGVGVAEAKNLEKMTPGVAPPQWQK